MEQQITPRTIFSGILEQNRPQAMAWVTGGRGSQRLSGLVKFYETPYAGVLVEAEVFNLPAAAGPCAPGYFGMHIHEFGNCGNEAGEPFARAGAHFNPGGCPHPAHAGDLPPLLANNQGYAWTAFYDSRFTLRDIMGKTVIIHAMADDFRSQPAGDSGERIGCGVIRTA